ncbi:MAG: beta-ketoacyl-[acyl-carrier-protein] synthase family protein [Planctomycetota bacterium]|jgi:3-oxoacyl-[acyl-carrier-protein] synthase II
MSKTRVVITGFGAASPLGLTSEEMWAGLCAGKCGISRISAFDPVGMKCQIAGQIPEFKIRQHVPKALRKATKLMSRDIEISILAANEAIANSGIVTKATDPENINIDPTRTAINLGAGLISCELEEIAPAIARSVTDGKFDIKKWGKEGIEQVTPLWLLKYLPNMLACHIGIIHDIQGPSNTITCAEVSGLLAIGEAAQIIARGSADMALAGGAEAKVNPIVMIRQELLKRATFQSNDAPVEACRPFAADAKGCVFGEGAGVVVLENIETATKRKAHIHAEIAGIGESCSINHPYEQLESDGKGIRIAIENALADAHIEPDRLGLIIPHGTGIAADDLAEAKGIEAAIGSAVENVPVWPTKSMLSNTGAGAGAIDLIAAMYAMRDGKIPSAKNCDSKAEGCNLNINTKPAQNEILYVLCCGYTFGGQAAAIIIKKHI